MSAVEKSLSNLARQQAGNKPTSAGNLSVRALIESLENTGSHSVPMNVSTRATSSNAASLMRSPGSTHRSIGSSICSPMPPVSVSEVLAGATSKSTTHLANVSSSAKPLDLDSSDLFLKTPLKAASETEMQSLSNNLRPSPLRFSLQAAVADQTNKTVGAGGFGFGKTLNREENNGGHAVDIGGSDLISVGRSKGILVHKSLPSASRKSYL